MHNEKSSSHFTRAKMVIPGGVNSPVRAFSKVGCEPLFYDHAKGSHVWDVDGNEYIDFICSWGPMIFGHGDDDILTAVRTQIDKGTSFGAPCEAEIRLAELICDIVPAAERVRMVSSGTEATMSALRLARGFTGCDKFIKFEGNYHGHSDALLVSAGSGLATLGIPDTPGVTAKTASDTLVCDYNNIAEVKACFAKYPHDIAAIIVEPIAGNMGVVMPEPGFLEGLRDVCDEFGAVLIFDEVISGFRASLGGAQELFNITPDLCTFGKIIGGGFPVGCLAGKAKIMDSLAPVGPVYQAGTLSGNPVAMEAGYAALTKLKNPDTYDQLNRKGALLAETLRNAALGSNAPVTVNQAGSLATLFFTPTTVRNWTSAATSDTDAFARYFRAMLDEGFLIAPSQFEALFVSLAHTDEEITAFGQAAARSLRKAYV